MKTWILVADILGWPVIQLSISSSILSLPLTGFSGNSSLYAIRRWESDGTFYREWLGIKHWKSHLPDGAPWLGGFAKKKLLRHDPQYLFQFMLETRRAECAHLCMLVCLPVFFIWNPLWACCVMTIYAVAANVPCIAVQRYNRAVLLRLISRKGARH